MKIVNKTGDIENATIVHLNEGNPMEEPQEQSDPNDAQQMWRVFSQQHPPSDGYSSHELDQLDLAAYLDGRMTPAEREIFESTLADDADNLAIMADVMNINAMYLYQGRMRRANPYAR